METKVIRFEIRFTRTALVRLLGLMLLLAGLRAGLAQGQEPQGGTVSEEEVTAGGGIAAPQSTVDDGFWYQGRLTDGSGSPLANTSVNATVRIYNVASGGTALDSTTVTVDTDENGLFNEEIDFNNPDLFNGQALYLGLRMEGEASEMSPRQYLRVVPYAMSIRPGALISTSASYDPVLEIRSNYSSTNDCDGLYVTDKTASSFEVHELGGGTANVAFDYRIVAIRKGYEQVRMEPLTEGGKPMVVDIPAAPSVASEPGEP